jgi:hypothetical protein
MKRPLDGVTSAINSVQLRKGWLPKLLQVNHDNLALILGEIANEAKISSYDFKKARTTLRSFSTTNWADFATQFGLPSDPEVFMTNAKQATIPVFRLPPSFHKRIVEVAWRAQDVYREILDQREEAARVRVLDTVRD